jgi:hypothetical protein
MGKIGKILSAADKETAIANGIPLPTVYKRIDRGWSVADAITKPARSGSVERPRDDIGEFLPKAIALGRGRSTRLPADLDQELDSLIEASGQSQSDFLAAIIVEWLQKKALISGVSDRSSKSKNQRTAHTNATLPREINP